MKRLLLISQSPRRREILSQFGFDFVSHTVEVSEFLNKNMNLDEQIQDLAQRKVQGAQTFSNILNLKDFIALGADTLVIFQGRVLGKPQNETEACETLRLLSGQKHEVKTAVALWRGDTGETCTFIETTEVEFRDLSDQEIYDYVATGDPMDKAGSYGIQGEAGQFVKNYRGSYWNVVGLPIEKVQEKLQKLNWSVVRQAHRYQDLEKRFSQVQSVVKSFLGDLEKSVQLVAVSKGQSVDDIFTLYDLGQRVFAENYVQEALPKQVDLRGRAPEIQWHFIGRLQRNKVKSILGHFDLIHSIDREDIFFELEKQISKVQGDRQKVLLQINIDREESKAGFLVEDVVDFVARVRSSHYIEICGLMALPSLQKEKQDGEQDEEREGRRAFTDLRQLSEKISPLLSSSLILSMGTSGDFQWAIQEGATHIRVGTALFGPRQKQILEK